ncbi:MAG TPA: hypothetical protein VF407_03510 [Polyangiaceae bacterium]
MRSFRVLTVALVAACSALTFACSSSSSNGTTNRGGDGGGDGGGGASLVGDTSKITASQSNGFDGPGPDGSTCSSSSESFTYDVGTKTLTWTLCENDGGIQVATPGSRVLSDDEAASFRETLDEVSVDTTVEDSCATDAPVRTMSIDGTAYEDQLEHCRDDGRAYASGIGAVLYDASQLARN